MSFLEFAYWLNNNMRPQPQTDCASGILIRMVASQHHIHWTLVHPHLGVSQPCMMSTSLAQQLRLLKTLRFVLLQEVLCVGGAVRHMLPLFFGAPFGYSGLAMSPLCLSASSRLI
ncbi:hypothetical protein PV04_02221 [Phialophora macrospora]|uniref:Uncharacterized protein n=1 Tax=Phialophora macrospora TaxID=1851006 RepID=A0A0D2GCR6_9EURO|nr:hypothetical protein PV04_02221 [Phialophora macrospora]